jgi:hypothetical protein
LRVASAHAPAVSHASLDRKLGEAPVRKEEFTRSPPVIGTDALRDRGTPGMPKLAASSSMSSSVAVTWSSGRS